ncbi:MAG: hypothetical protein KJ043_10790, partial [Anaerolineae bacterium]|nr:hypothetical protein [Anaerolineae bacterium]
WIRNASSIGRGNRIKRGLPSSGILSTSHKLIRDTETGRATEIVINEDMKYFYRCLGELVLEGISWKEMGIELFNRWKFTSSTGTYYRYNGLHYRMYNPLIWGNLADGRHKYKYSIGEWIFYDHPSKPEGINMVYGVLEPVYEGKFATDIRNELICRIGAKGKTRAKDIYRFSNMCICGVCGGNMTVASRQAPKSQYGEYRKFRLTDYGTAQWGLVCLRRYQQTLTGERCCSSTSAIYQDTLEKFWASLLDWMAEGKPIHTYFDPNNLKNLPFISPIDVNAEIQKTESQIQTLIYQQSLAPEVTQKMYRDKIFQLSEHLQTLQEQYNAIVEESRYMNNHITLETIQSIRIEDIWVWEDIRINRFLKSILGRNRLIVINGEVVGMKIV